MKSLVVLTTLAVAGVLGRINLPDPTLDTILASSQAGVGAQAFLKTAQVLGLLRVEFSDFGLVRKAHVITGNTDLTLVGFPFLGWYKF